MNVTFKPTQEQLDIINAAQTGDNLIIQAYAGASKTTTLRLIAESLPQKRILYLAFNKGIVTDAVGKMPKNVECRTVHSIAYANGDKKLISKINNKNFDAKQLLKQTQLKDFKAYDRKLDKEVILTPLRLFGWAKQTAIRFMQSADSIITHKHVYIDNKFAHLEMKDIKDPLVEAANVIWALYNADNNLQIPHDVYLKKFAMSGIDLKYDVVMVDECQDVSPVMLKILDSQKKSQMIFVGDQYQKIYTFTGSIDISTLVDYTKLYLTKSFRFGNEISSVANSILLLIDPNRPLLYGNDTTNKIEATCQPNAILCRTNSKVLQEFLYHKTKYPNAKINVTCDTTNILDFANGLIDLEKNRKTDYPLMRIFSSVNQFYSWLLETDEPIDIEYEYMAVLCKQIKPQIVIDLLNSYREHIKPDIIISTAHKAKGLEWDTVQLSNDFPILKKDNVEELRLFYVALTRAKKTLNGFNQYKGIYQHETFKNMEITVNDNINSSIHYFDNVLNNHLDTGMVDEDSEDDLYYQRM